MTDEEIKLKDNFYHNVKLVAKTRGLTFYQIEAECGLNFGCISSLNMHRRRVPKKADKIAEYLKVPLDELLKDMIDVRYLGTHRIDRRGMNPVKSEGQMKHEYCINPKICKTCKYRSGQYTEGTCNYVLIMGHSRPSTDLIHGGKNKTYTYNHCPEYEKGRYHREVPTSLSIGKGRFKEC